MNIGMLWFDNDTKAPLDTRVERAAVYYRNKYGQNPTLCFVHPSMLGRSNADPAPADPAPTEDAKVYTPTGVELRSHRSVLPNHFWIGMSGAS
jgi:hypothetical protein